MRLAVIVSSVVGGLRRRHPRDLLDFLDAATGVVWRVGWFGLRSRRSLPPSLWVPCPVLLPSILSLALVVLASWCPSLFCPPTSLPFPCTTVFVPITSLLTGEYFRGRPVRPHPINYPWTRTLRPPKRRQGPVPCPPPLTIPLPCSWSCRTLILTLNGHLAVISGPWVNPRHGRGPRDQVTALANRGTVTKSIICDK